MPIWTPEPPKDRGPYSFRIVRTPPAKPLTAVITSTDLLGCCTHFLKNRTVPCEGPDQCPACREGYSWRWHGYVACVLTQGLEHVLFECSATSSDTFRNYLQLYTNLRGCWFKAYRPSQRHNGRVVIECKYTDPAKHRLPEPPDVKRILCHIWNVKADAAEITGRVRPPFQQVGVQPHDGDGRNRP